MVEGIPKFREDRNQETQEELRKRYAEIYSAFQGLRYFDVLSTPWLKDLRDEAEREKNEMLASGVFSAEEIVKGRYYKKLKQEEERLSETLEDLKKKFTQEELVEMEDRALLSLARGFILTKEVQRIMGW